MSTSPNFNAPEWLRRLSQIPSRIFNASVDAASRLFSASWRHLVNGWNAARDFAAAHPKFTTAVTALVALVLAILFLQLLAKGIVTEIFGFGCPGIRAGSIAAKIQSFFFGGSVPAGSFFSILQSFGAR
ncbi:hypothetical protein EV363DRAFT_1274470 [Boletus edulis]|uniref:Uncharacterized protein n=1 Tax=Boletus edulis BED1 TaxID=1328754 RepID=A0AAD4BMX9_BOLED|nr:hypothetical protein EV363DRAFT_1274470 [Boletus edulis]KAF8434610.1 hypothetical protein L210DRAFT_3763097 [Boletus edulis BED1]